MKHSFGDKITNAIDNTIGFFSPARAYRRKAFRNASRMMAVSYRGADRGRLRADWYPYGFSADRDLLLDHKLLRERSRDLNRNDAFASGISNTIVINDVGAGIKPQSRLNSKILGITDDQAMEYQDMAETAWDEWVKYADAAEILDFYEIQSLVDRQMLENGEAILMPLMISDKKRPYSLSLAMIESDRLVSPLEFALDKDVRFGVRLGDRGEPVSYYIRDMHPGDLYAGGLNTMKYIEYPAKNQFGRKNVIHLYEQKRPGQTRGIPFFAPVLTYFKDLADYSEAELIAARIAACFALFVKKSDSMGALNGRSTADSSGKRIESIEPGMFEYLSEGEEIQSFNPNRPNAQFEPFVNHILKSICSALNLSYEIVSKDFSKSSYSSARAGLLQAYRYFRMRQDWLSRKFCQPIYEMVLEEAYLRGKFAVPDFYKNVSAWTRAAWIAPGWEWVDPLKEAEASRLAVDMGLSTLTAEAAGKGRDWDEVIGQRARECIKIKDLEDKNGIKIVKETVPTNVTSNAAPDNGNNNGGSDNGSKN